MMTQSTNSGFTDELSEEVEFNPVGKLYEFHFYTKKHKKIIRQMGRHLFKNTKTAVNVAIRKHLTYIKAKRFEDPNVAEKFRHKQAVVKLQTKGYLENLPETPVNIIVSEKIFPIRKISDLNSHDANRLVHTDLTVLGPSEMLMYIDRVELENGNVIEYKNYNPKTDGTITRRIYNDVQYLLCEEMSNNIAPRKITVKCYGGFVGKFHIADKLRILGYYEPNPDDDKEHRAFIDVINIEQIQKRKETKLSHNDLTMFRELSKNPEEYFKRLTDSFCSHIYENHLPKLGILLSSIISPRTESRSNMLLLLEGSPGVGKSEMLKAGLEISDNVAYVDAPNVSARGLLYGQEEFNKTKILRAGVLVRYGLALVDELDKMGKGQREELNTATEQQIASYHKTPFDMDTPINVGVIASANPAGGRWKDDRSIMENLGNLESTVIDRYLIIKVNKPQNNEAKYDLMLASIESDAINRPFSHYQLRGLINYAMKLNPKLTEKSVRMIKDFLISFSKIEQNELADLYIETRKEYDLLRVIKKMAQLLLRTEIDEECVKLGIQFYKDCMESIGLRTEAPTAQQMLPKDGSSNDIFWQIYRMLLKDSEDGKTVSESELKEEMDKSGKWNTPEKINEFLDRLKKQKLYEPRVGRIEKV